MLEAALEERYAPAVLTVETALDNGDPKSLRSLINKAHNGDTIVFDANKLANKEISLDNGQIVLTKSLTIDGGNNNITISGNFEFRLFYNPLGRSEEIDNLTLAFGFATNDGAPDNGNGGAIYNAGNLTLKDDHFVQDTAANSGGAVYEAASAGNGGGTS